MKKYRVGLCFTAYCMYVVEAEDEGAAVMAADALNGGGAEGNWDSWERREDDDTVEEVT
jgi:hypothetical protein